MKLMLYKKDTPKNAKLTRVGCLNVDRLKVDTSDSRLSWIECDQEQLNCQEPPCYHLVVTK